MNNINKLKNIADNLRKLRNKNRLSQREIAEKIGVSQTTYFNMENGQCLPIIEQVFNISNVFGLKIFLELTEKDIDENFQNLENFANPQNSETNLNNSQNFEKEKLFIIMEKRITELEDKLKRRDLKIEELKKLNI